MARTKIQLRDGEIAMENGQTTLEMNIRWVRILIGGSLAEAVLILLVIPVSMKWGQPPLLYLAPAGSLVLCFLFGFWVGRGVKSRFMLHGLLVGAVATAIYLTLTRLGPEPWEYVVAHGLKLIGEASGAVDGRAWSAMTWRS
jgi:hypothetical protein